MLFIRALAVVLACMCSTYACSAVGPTCAVIDIAHATCTLIRYREDDGTVREVRVSPEEARAFARTAAARHADGGAP